MINNIIQDPASGMIKFVQTDDASPFAVLMTGYLTPTYIGTGAPSPTTLAGATATSPYYRLYSYYLDITTPLAPGVWICVTAGDKTSSVWNPLGGGYIGEYDKTKPMSAGQTAIISQALIIDGKTCPPGIIGVDPAGTDIYGNKFSGSLPANPTGANVPQSPLPTPGTVTNAARYITLFCQSV